MIFRNIDIDVVVDVLSGAQVGNLGSSVMTVRAVVYSIFPLELSRDDLRAVPKLTLCRKISR